MIKQPLATTEDVSHLARAITLLHRFGIVELEDAGISRLPGTPYHQWGDVVCDDDGGFTHVLDLGDES